MGRPTGDTDCESSVPADFLVGLEICAPGLLVLAALTCCERLCLAGALGVLLLEIGLPGNGEQTTLYYK